MKSVHTGWKIPNMRGKKFYRFSCMCCEAIDFREMLLKREHEKEIREYLGINGKQKEANQ